MTIRELRLKIESWENDTMDFCIEEVFSWRGIYAEPACSISTRTVTKEHNLQMLDELISRPFQGWKGGEFEYVDYDTLNFESSWGSWTDGAYLMFFIENNQTPIIQHIFG